MKGKNNMVFKREFTLREANKALSLVKPIVQEIISLREEIADLFIHKKNSKNNTEKENLNWQIEQKQEQIIDALKELKSIGCRLRKHQLGAVDFPSRLKGKRIYLSWQIEEPCISHWYHEPSSLENRNSLDMEMLLTPSKQN